MEIRIYETIYANLELIRTHSYFFRVDLPASHTRRCI